MHEEETNTQWNDNLVNFPVHSNTRKKEKFTKLYFSICYDDKWILLS